MIKKILFIFVLVTGMGAAAPAQELETTKDSIRHVINQETRYFATGNYEDWKKTWVTSPKALHTGASNVGFHKRQGWESIHSSLKTYMQDTANTITANRLVLKRRDFEIVVDGDMAFAYFISHDNLNQEQGQKLNDKMESRVLKRVDGKWKILYVNTIDISTYE